MAEGKSPLYGFGPFVLDVADGSLKRDGALISLTPKQFDLLVALVENAGRLVEKDALLRRVWPDVAVEEGNLTKGVFSLRQVLDQDAGTRHIETIPKRGYRFQMPVTVRTATPAGAAEPTETEAAPVENSIATTTSARAWPSRSSTPSGASPTCASRPTRRRCVSRGRRLIRSR
jgi:DNA-binding winged helix-turn-helix (wHTH) protein